MKTPLAHLVTTAATAPDFWCVPGRIAYVVSHSYPYASHGYAVRTHAIATGLVQHGHSVIAITRPGRPWDIPGFSDNDFPLHHDIDGVRYLHLPKPSTDATAPAEWRKAAAAELEKNLRIFKPSAVMAASNWENALPAMLAARKLGLPFYYEVRGFWELSRLSWEPEWENSPEYKEAIEKETLIARAADKVFTLNKLMRDELVRRGIDADKIEIIPNAFGALPDLSTQTPLSKADLGCATQYVVGYVGSFSEYEGLDDLVRACAQLRNAGTDVSLLLVGASSPLSTQLSGQLCPFSEKLKKTAYETGLSQHLHLTGRVPPQDLGKYYGLIDLVVIPRKSHTVTELVSPIKPLEAAAFGKAMLLADVGPQVEIALESGGATFRKSDITDLCRQMAALLGDSRLRQHMGAQARAWVETKRSLPAIVRPMAKAFKSNTMSFPPGKPIAAEVHVAIQNEAPPRLRVAGVMDEFTFHSYDPECELLQLHPETCLEQLAAFKPDMLFIESAWKGLEGMWHTKISNNGPEINACIQWCKANQVPTLFWNKEDPVHFSTFVPLAQQVDYVFTTDIDCIPKYKHSVGHDRVYLLPFAAQPKTHNPIELFERKDAFNFAGSYYLRYPERQRDFAALIDTVKEFKPVDIYDRNFDNPHPHYTFPDSYKPMILGKLPFEEIDKAYKGYRYGINMNTIKQSQTMFARRVFELLASNTVVVSNFSRGVRLLFGDLVISSDDAGQLRRSLQNICNDDTAYRKLRLMGLRKVMMEHTYAHRIAYIKSKLKDSVYTPNQPAVAILAVARTVEEKAHILMQFQQQSYANRSLYLLQTYSAEPSTTDNAVHIYTRLEALQNALNIALQTTPLLGLFSANDYYGKEYITDLTLASTYAQANAYGKAAMYHVQNGTCQLRDDGRQYRTAKSLAARSSLIRSNNIDAHMLQSWLKDPVIATLDLPSMLATDEFQYCRDGASLKSQELHRVVGDLSLTNLGTSFVQQLAPTAEMLEAAAEHAVSDNGLPELDAGTLFKLLPTPQSKQLQVSFKDGELRVQSTLPTDKHAYIYANKRFTREELNLVLNSQFKLDAEHTLGDLRTVFEFQDENGQKIAHAMNNGVGGKHSLAIPNHCRSIRFGLRISGPGNIAIKRLVLGNHGERPAAIAGRSPYLVLAKQYPAYDDLYRYGFLHSRVRAYKEHGLNVEVFRLTNESSQAYREFENIDIACGDASLLSDTLKTGRYKHVLVHLLDENMWRVLEQHLDTVKVTVWAHGAEIQDWKRRSFEFELMSASEVTRQKKLSDKRKKFWREILKSPHPNLHLVFVSKTFSQEVAEDLNMALPTKHYSVVHNYVDSEIFPYKTKKADDRLKILSIRSFASRKYGNDLSINAILDLSKRPYFENLNFHIVGDGLLFDETVAPLRQFKNIKIDKCFLNHSEIAELQSSYGVFLNPTRWDSQGVSRDEAMSSGLVPITSAVAAVPEFIDSSCAIAVPAESYKGLADAIEFLYKNPDKYLQMSGSAAQRVRQQCGMKETILKEIRLINRP